MEPCRRCVVVTPTFNSERFLDETIASVVLQAAPDVGIDYHIQDGGSTDATEAIVRAWIERIERGAVPRLARSVRLTYASARDGGMYDAINTAFAVLAPQPADVVTWINSDDRLAPGAVATIAQVFADHPECEFVSGRTALLNEAGSIVSLTYPQAFTRALLAGGAHDGRAQSFIMQEGTFFTGRLWTAVGGVDASFRLAGDWDLWRRMARETAHHSIDTVTAFHRRRAGQLSSDMESYHAEVDATLEEPRVGGGLEHKAGAHVGIDTLPQLIRYDADVDRWIKTPFDTLASRPPIAVIDGRRRRSCGVSYLDGFGAPEGPYPQYRLPAGVRWLREPSAEIAVEAPYDGAFRITMTLRPTATDLTLRVHLNGLWFQDVPLAPPVPDTDQLVAVSAWLGVGRNVIEIEMLGDSDSDGEAEDARLLLVVACAVIAEADGGRAAPRDRPVPTGELLRAVNGTAVVVTDGGDPTRLVETLASVRDVAGAALFVRVEPGGDAAGVVEAFAPYAELLGPDDASWRERLRGEGYRAAIEIAAGDRLRADALIDAHRILRDRSASTLVGLIDVVDGSGAVVRGLLPGTAGPTLHDLTAEGDGLVRAPLRLAARHGQAKASEGTAPQVWLVDQPDTGAPTGPLLTLAGALRMLGVDARYARGQAGGGIVIAAAGAPGAEDADYQVSATDRHIRLVRRGGGEAVTLPRAIDAETFRPRARRSARAALGLPGGAFLVLADSASIEPVRRAVSARMTVVALSATPIEGCVTLPAFADSDTLAHVLSAADAVVAARDSWLALAAPACAVPTIDVDGAIVTADGVPEPGPGLAQALRRLSRGRAAPRLQAAEARASVERAATLEALALALHDPASAIPELRDWLAARDDLAAGTIDVPTDVPFALEAAQVAQHRGFALQPLSGAVAEADPVWSQALRLTATEAALLLRVEDIAGSALRLHLSGPEGSTWTVQIDGETPAPVWLGADAVTTARIAAPLAPGLHRVTLRAASPVANARPTETMLVAWEVVSTRETADPEVRRTRVAFVPLAGREVASLVRDGDWVAGEGFLKPEAPHPAAGLWAPFRWTRGDRAAFRLRNEHGGARTIDLAVTGIAGGLRMRLVVGAEATEWSAPLAAYVGRVSHARWSVDWPMGDLDVTIELGGRGANANPRDLGVLLLGIAVS